MTRNSSGLCAVMLAAGACTGAGVPVDLGESDADPGGDVTVQTGPSPFEDRWVDGGGTMSSAFEPDGSYAGMFVYATFSGGGTLVRSKLAPESCFTESRAEAIPGAVDLGPAIKMKIGEDVLDLRRNTEWEPGQIVYKRERNGASHIAADAGVMLLGVDTDTHVPAPLGQLDPAAISTFGATGALDLSWEGGGGDYIELTLWWGGPNDAGYPHQVACRFEDDGQARVVAAPVDIARGMLMLARYDDARIEIPEIGAVEFSNSTNVSVGYP